MRSARRNGCASVVFVLSSRDGRPAPCGSGNLGRHGEAAVVNSSRRPPVLRASEGERQTVATAPTINLSWRRRGGSQCRQCVRSTPTVRQTTSTDRAVSSSGGPGGNRNRGSRFFGAVVGEHNGLLLSHDQLLHAVARVGTGRAARTLNSVIARPSAATITGTIRAVWYPSRTAPGA